MLHAKPPSQMRLSAPCHTISYAPRAKSAPLFAHSLSIHYTHKPSHPSPPRAKSICPPRIFYFYYFKFRTGFEKIFEILKLKDF